MLMMYSDIYIYIYTHITSTGRKHAHCSTLGREWYDVGEMV